MRERSDVEQLRRRTSARDRGDLVARRRFEHESPPIALFVANARPVDHFGTA